MDEFNGRKKTWRVVAKAEFHAGELFHRVASIVTCLAAASKGAAWRCHRQRRAAG